MEKIASFMKEQFNPKHFTVRERFKFWSDMQRKPGETLQELAACIRQDAATFPSVTDLQDETLRQRFICSVNNEAVLKALFKIKDTELDFVCAVQVAFETEKTVYDSKTRTVNKVKQTQNKGQRINHQCGKAHKVTNCPYKEVNCNFWDKKGHLETVRSNDSNGNIVPNLL
uniref:Uncharacterized protein n=1 Tax=Octopus bimaculoides TaxID=37653 RepID=A0A0L8IHG9_OCTBM